MLFLICQMLPRKEVHMKNRHMTLEMRERIEKGIRDKEKLKDIANAIDKDPTTISKEVLKRRNKIEVDTKPIPTTSCWSCINKVNCIYRRMCNNEKCGAFCKYCKKVDVTQFCKQYKEHKCKRITRFPYVCNGCSTRRTCYSQKYEYQPLFAHKEYLKELHESRQGLNLTSDEYKLIDNALTEGFKNGQSINHIIANNPKLNISVKTGYNYVNSGNFKVKHDDLPNYVNHILKKRRVTIPKEYEYQENKDMNRKGREYYDYIQYVDTNNITYHAEMDCVGITKDYNGALLSIIIPKWSFLLLYKLEVKDMAHVKEKIDFIYKCLGEKDFNKYFGVILTDRGPEFNDYQGIEFDDDGVKRCHLFYCDSGQSTQKPFIERVNREIRRYVFKGQSVEKLDQEDCNIIANNINNMTLDSLGKRTPYEFAKTFLGELTLHKLGIVYIKPKDLLIKNIDMIKCENKKKSR